MPGGSTTARALTLGLAALLVAAPAMAQAPLSVDGTELVLTTRAGRTLHSADLVGATLTIAAGGTQVEVTIRSVEEDRYAVGGRVLLHHFVVTDESGRQTDLCTPDAEGRSRGFPVPDGRGGFELTCTSGAVGKCIRWGYRPWDEQPGGPPLAALHQACVRMTRADYGGDGSAGTREGTTVHVCDRFGVRPCHQDAPLAFEAAWRADGAVCVARPRVADVVTLEQLAERYPRLKARLGPAACNEERALRDAAALLFNRSQE
jgi:ADYC domain